MDRGAGDCSCGDVYACVDRARAVAAEGAPARDAVMAALEDLRRVRAWADAQELVWFRHLRRCSPEPGSDLAKAAHRSRSHGAEVMSRAHAVDAIAGLGEAIEKGSLDGAHATVAAKVLASMPAALKAAAAVRFALEIDEAARTGVAPSEFADRLRAEGRRLEADDGQAALSRQRGDTRLRTWLDKATGMWRLSGRFDPVSGLRLHGRLDAAMAALFAESAPTTAPDDPVERADHLRALALLALTGGFRVGTGEGRGGRGAAGAARTDSKVAGQDAGPDGEAAPADQAPSMPGRDGEDEGSATADETDAALDGQGVAPGCGGTAGVPPADGRQPVPDCHGDVARSATPGETDVAVDGSLSEPASAGSSTSPSSGDGEAERAARRRRLADDMLAQIGMPSGPNPSVSGGASGGAGDPWGKWSGVLGGSGRFGRPEVIVVIDTTALDEHGRPTVDWGLPIPIPWASLRDVVGERPLVWPVVVDRGRIVAARGELNRERDDRLANRAQRRALPARHPTCSVEGCGARFDNCTLHHIRWWRLGGRTNLDELIPLCSKHHHRVHDDGWLLVLYEDRAVRLLPPGALASLPVEGEPVLADGSGSGDGSGPGEGGESRERAASDGDAVRPRRSRRSGRVDDRPRPRLRRSSSRRRTARPRAVTGGERATGA